VIYITPKGQAMRSSSSHSSTLMLPVLQCVREAEAAVVAKQKAVVSELSLAGVCHCLPRVFFFFRVWVALPHTLADGQSNDLTSRRFGHLTMHSNHDATPPKVDTRLIPADELKRGAGPVLDAELNWLRMLKRLSVSNPTKAAQYTQLAARVARWRQQQAAEFTMAPGAVLAAHLIKGIAYTQPSSVEVLRSIGARVGDLQQLVALVAEAKVEFGWAADLSTSLPGAAGGSAASRPLQIRPGVWQSETPAQAMKPSKKPPQWMTTLGRFVAGESCEAIAVTGGASGQAILPQSVVRSMLTALVHGKGLDLARLHAEARMLEGGAHVPTQVEWGALARGLEDGADLQGVHLFLLLLLLLLRLLLLPSRSVSWCSCSCSCRCVHSVRPPYPPTRPRAFCCCKVHCGKARIHGSCKCVARIYDCVRREEQCREDRN
jgi:hypothetical protein